MSCILALPTALESFTDIWEEPFDDSQEAVI